MLRTLLGEAPRNDNGPLGETEEAMELFAKLCGDVASRYPGKAVRYRTYAVWTEGLRRSLDELDESLFAARHFAERIRHRQWAELSAAEKLDYDRHVYFDKNAYIRVFALLDKLGTLLNDLLELKTERVKARFSFFTVLRRMRDTRRHGELASLLTALKEEHQDAMNRLRMRRNMEIHYMNAELQDDLRASHATGAGNGETWKLENLVANLDDSREGWEMVLGTLGHSFRFACARLRKLS